METKLNIAEILKNKPKGTKLYSPLFGNVYFSDINNSTTYVLHHTSMASFYSDATFIKFEEAEPLLFPSKEMRDWSKFAWKKGDVLVSMEGSKILFDKWASEDYTKFLGKIKILGNSHCYDTAYYTLASKEEVLKFIKSVEEINNGKLNLETLEIEKQPEFKDGDILCVIDNSDNYHYILIYKGQDDKNIYRYVTMFLDGDLNLKDGAYLTKPKDYFIRYTTSEEKQKLFAALAKEGKAWDSEKKIIVELKPKCKFKPFDKVLGRNEKDDVWEAELFSHYREESQYPFCCIGFARKYCIPYEGNEHLLGTTKDVEG